jgi:hypothetical protein
MELHVAENYYYTLGCCEATCSFHLEVLDLSPKPSPRRGELDRASEKCDIYLYIIVIQRNTDAKVEYGYK